MIDRRRFLVGTMGAAYLASRSADSLAESAAVPVARGWDSGRVKHLLPVVNDRHVLVKASFTEPQTVAPVLRVGTTAARGQMTDTAGECWQFHAAGLDPGRRYSLSLADARGRALCQPWDLATFPSRGSRPERVRILFFTCAGGPDGAGLLANGDNTSFLPTAVRNRLLRRGLSFQPDAAVANGDHIYWDQLAPVGSRNYTSPEVEKLSGKFDRSAVVLGSDNETVLKRIGNAQIAPIYRTDFRSTPMFFLQDDHDHFDNDEATDEIITFPPPYFSLQLARATQYLYYPEFLPDVARPFGLPWSSTADRPAGISESFGTLRYGRLAEVLLYDIRRTATLAGPSAVYVDLEVEKWLRQRTAATEVTHLVHAPSNPPGWTAGKWGEWYP